MTQTEYEMHNISEGSKTTPADELPARPSLHSSRTAREPVTTTLSRRRWPLVLVAFYAAFALTSWIVLCITSKRPVGGPKNYYDTHFYRDQLWKSTRFSVESLLKTNERVIKFARVLQIVASLLTIPVTSAICGIACVVHMQAGRSRTKMTLRQTMALADQGWLSVKALVNESDKKGSFPLYAAFALVLTGFTSQILQNVFVNQESIRAAQDTSADTVRVVDVPALFNGDATTEDDGTLIYQLRSHLDSVSRDDFDSNPWIEAPSAARSLEWFINAPYRTAHGDDLDAFFAPLPFNFSSGAYPVPQYMPRMSSHLEYVNITEDEFKANCRNDTDNGGFYARYESSGGERWDFLFEACMAGDLRTSPWRPTRDRQDITEVLYLNVNTSGTDETYFKATARSELGYFEVPGHTNGYKMGPLLDSDPLASPDRDLDQTRGYRKRDANETYSGNSTLMGTPNKGPLCSLALALFGPGSFPSRISIPSAYVFSKPAKDDLPAWGMCVGLAPLTLFGIHYSCLRGRDVEDDASVEYTINDWLEQFTTGGGFSGVYDIQGPLNAALFLANKLWLYTSVLDSGYYDMLDVHYDEGIETVKTKISTVGMAIGSIFLGMHLLGLLALAMWAYVMRPWAEKLGAEVMVKMGVVYADALQLGDGEKEWRSAVESLPGFIGDERPGEGVGRMSMGAESGLSRRALRKFEVLR